VVRRVFAIAAAARRLQTRPVFRRHYRALLALTRAVVREAETMGRRVSQHLHRVPAATRPQLARLQRTLRTTLPLVQRVIHQTVARVVHGDEHVRGKVLSLFEPHTEAIRKGKVVKPTEFGKLVAIQEAEHQVITAYTVYPVRPADRTLWVPALDVHQELFGRAPDLAAADRGFSSAANERAATARRVRRVVLPQQGRRFPAWAALARRLRGPDQCLEAPPRPRALPLSRAGGHGTVGRARGHRPQPAHHRDGHVAAPGRGARRKTTTDG
jgi:IS5 family transposase